MKKFLVLFVFVFLLAACAPVAIATSSAVQLPDALKVAVNGLILAGVMFGLQLVFDYVGIDLRGLGAGIALAIAEFAIAQFQGIIDVIPAQYDQLVMIGLQVLLAILTGLGFVRIMAHRDRTAQLLRK